MYQAICKQLVAKGYHLKDPNFALWALSQKFQKSDVVLQRCSAC